MSEKKELPVGFQEDDQSQEVAVVPDKKALAKAAKAAEDKEILRIRQVFNTRTMRIKTRLLADAGVEIRNWGVKEVGHGRLHYAGDNADRAIAAIQEDIDRLMSESHENPKKADAVAELRAIQLRFNKQIIEVGKLHLEAAREAGGKGGGSDMRIGFPAGQTVLVAMSPGSSSPVNVNDKGKALTEGESGP